LARRLTTILPAMNLPEALDTTHIHSLAGLSTEAVDVLGQLRIRFQE
jgi:predicted ATPase with chaperone activity